MNIKDFFIMVGSTTVCTLASMILLKHWWPGILIGTLLGGILIDELED